MAFESILHFQVYPFPITDPNQSLDLFYHLIMQENLCIKAWNSSSELLIREICLKMFKRTRKHLLVIWKVQILYLLSAVSMLNRINLDFWLLTMAATKTTLPRQCSGEGSWNLKTLVSWLTIFFSISFKGYFLLGSSNVLG